MIKAVIFDLDNTLYDYDTAHEAAYGAITEYARQAFGLSAEEFDALYKEGDRVLQVHIGTVCAAIHNRLIRFQMMLEQIGKPLSHAPKMLNLYWSVFLDATEPFPDAAECIMELRNTGYTVGIGTNMTADYQFAKLERLCLLDQVDFLVTSEEAGAEKPDSRLFACCVEKAGCAPEECLFVGDNLEMDVFGARRAGLYSVWLSPQGKDVPGVRRIQALARLPDLLRLF